MQTQLRTLLLNDATISGLVSTRVDWGVRPQGRALPAITLILVSDGRDQRLDGLQTTQGPLVQIDCWADGSSDPVGAYATISTLREAVVSLLATPVVQSGTRFLGAQNIYTQDLPEKTDVGFVQRAMIRANVWHTT